MQSYDTELSKSSWWNRYNLVSRSSRDQGSETLSVDPLLQSMWKPCSATDKISSSLNMFRLTSDPQALLTWQISGFELHLVRLLVCILNSLELHSAGLSGTNQLTSCDTLKSGWIITNLTAACRGVGGGVAIMLCLLHCVSVLLVRVRVCV